LHNFTKFATKGENRPHTHTKDVFEDCSFKPKTFFKPIISTYFKFETSFKLSLSSPRPFSSSLFQLILSLKHRSSSFFQAQDVFQDRSFKPQDLFQASSPSSPRHIFEDCSVKPKTYFKASSFKPTFSSPLMLILIEAQFEGLGEKDALRLKP
jgi:hypothetical protein